MGEKLCLLDVTLIAVCSMNLEDTQRALLSSSEHIDFGAIKMLSPVPPPSQYPNVQYVQIPDMDYYGYQKFMIEELHRYVDTSHCLVVQADGFVIDPQNWSDEFLAYDYIGAPWGEAVMARVDQEPVSVLHLDRNRVGNGGFSIRSKKLLKVTAGLEFDELDFFPKVEDIVICHFLYEEMIEWGIKFAPPELAARFSIESTEQLYGQTLQTVFGFHGKHWLEAVRQQVKTRNNLEEADYQYTNNWFGVNAKSLWDSHIPQINPTRILEIGSYEGASTCYLINKLANQNDIEVHCIDTWEGGVEHKESSVDMSDVEKRFQHNTNTAIKKANNKVNLVIHKGFSDIELSKLIASGKQGYFDFIYIDGSHEAPDVLCDALLGFRLLRNNGVIAFDDYLWQEQLPYGIDPIRCPKPAIDAFTNIYCRKIRVMTTPLLYQLFVQKIND